MVSHCTVRGGRAVKGIERCDDLPEDNTVEPQTFAYDAVAVASGTHNYSCLPSFPGQEQFQGQLIHTENYSKPEDYKGKRVLIIGAGESGSDICNEISYHAEKVAIAIRGKHGHIIPRIQAHGRVTDLNTNRCRYSNPYIFGDWIGWVTQLAKRYLALFGSDTDLNKILRKISELNMYQKTSAFSKTGCKNEGFVSAMVLRNAELYRDSFVIQENGVLFENGSFYACDTIIACTGYRNHFPFFDEYHPELSLAGCLPRDNYKQIFAISYPKEIAFFGFARPAFGSVPPTVEMQSRFFAMVLNNDIKLPSQQEMIMIAKQDRLEWEQRFGYDAKRVIGLVDFQIYLDSLATIMNVMPPLKTLFFSQPWLWYKIMFGPFTTHQYRLVGPYANRQRAEEVYRRTPTGDFLESSITASFLMIAKLLSFIGFTRFRPNNF
jgi:dimethylaniline monooxygenase (N-oxide forming)